MHQVTADLQGRGESLDLQSPRLLPGGSTIQRPDRMFSDYEQDNEIGRTPLVWSTCLTVIMEYVLVAPFFIWKRKGRACPGFFLRQPGHLIARPAAFHAFFAKGSAFREISGSFCIVHAANE